ncbi:transcription termination/antitermination protein NusG [Levilactobacillus bambusae]|uniref:Transcription termination/antitermination protein NusG n=1 Tax=Levilactobacillus bambusae TaxID=2024736 RepID=A0A2V1MZ03_9LACO|nr:transcription termination/antitermination protein NusG [Levilactobacillus bambusae]PWF99375.1 transcription termination/antitermination protein NusG [Levilactobacillus bambusae]
MVESEEKRWYVLHTYSGYENSVKTNLESRIESMGMQDNIYRIIVPEEEKQEKKNGKDKTVMEKIFPGYVLVEMVMSDRAWYIVRNTPGVTGFIGSHGQGSKPTPLMPDEIDRIFKELGMGGQARHANLDVEVGETVKIIDGAFTDLEGKITAIDNKNGKLKVNIDMFGRETAAELSFDQVDPITD